MSVLNPASSSQSPFSRRPALRLFQAIVGGDIKGALAGAAAPYIANEIAKAIPEKDRPGRVLAHAIVNAALAAASGKDAGTAAAGAATGELAGMIALDAWDKTVDQLSEEEKQTVSALATLASGLAGGLVGDSGANAVAGAQAGKTVVENNALSANQLSGFAQRARTCTGDSCESVIRDMITLNAEQQVELAELCSTDPKQCQAKFGYLVEQWPAFDAMIKHMAADGTLPDDFRDALTPMYAQGLEAEGILANSGWTERFEAMGANKEIALAMAATLPMLISGTKGAKGAKNTTTGNGYKISNGSDTVIAKAALDHPIVQSRINVQNGNSKQGWEHVVQ